MIFLLVVLTEQVKYLGVTLESGLPWMPGPAMYGAGG